MKLNPNDIAVTSFETAANAAAISAMVACTPTLDSLVEEICPNGLSDGCHETTVPE
jgi:hypothetical protein